MIASQKRRALAGPVDNLLDTVTKGSKALASDTVAEGLDKFTRETEGGKLILSKVSIYANVPYLAIGFVLGMLLARK
jgi:hypothetical protein